MMNKIILNSLMLVLILNSLKQSEFSMIIIASVILIFGNFRFPKNSFEYENIYKFVIYWIFIIYFGILIGFISGNDTYIVFKDAWYYLKVILLVLYSILIYYTSNLKNIVTVFYKSGIIIVLIYISNYVQVLKRVKLGDLYFYKISIPTFPIEILLLMIIIIFLYTANTKFNRAINSILILLISILAMLSLSRTVYLFLVLILFFIKKTYSYIYVISLISIAIVLNKVMIIDEFIVKLGDSTKEIFDFNNFSINNWRAWENKKALSQYFHGNIFNMLVGYGFGEQIELGLNIKLGGNYFSKVPWIHNGYLYCLLKNGFIGLCVYVIFIFNMFRNAVLFSHNNKIKYALIIMSIFLILSTLVVGGLFNKYLFDSFLILFVILSIQIKTEKMHENITL